MLISILLMMLLSAMASPMSLHPTCYLEPDNLAYLKQKLLEPLNILFTHETVNNIPGFVKSSIPIGPDDIPSNFVRIQRIPNSMTATCPASPNVTALELNMRTSCPVTWVTNHDSNRWPRSVGETACTCDKCLEFSADGTQTQNRCEPVFYYIWALRRVGCNGIYYRYSQVREKVQISCTCAHPYVQISTGNPYPQLPN